jgi:hypothetical protein
LLGIRRALKGNASDVVWRLGTGVTVKQVLDKLESTFGNIDTKESILCKFYSCRQKPTELIAAYTSRLEELFSQAVELKGLHHSDNEQLKRVLYEGLKADI